MVLRRMCAALICMVFMCGHAIADTDGDIRCWTTNVDAHYHMKQDCTDEKMFPISESAAIAFGKSACEKCVVVEDTQFVYTLPDVSLGVRNGTYVMCIPDESLESIDGLTPYDSPKSMAYVQDEAWQQLAGMMSESSRDELRRRLEADDWASDICRIPCLEVGENVLSMNRRLIGDKWYFVFRPDKVYGDSAEITWRIDEWNIHMEGYGTLTVTNTGYADCVSVLKTNNHSDASVVLEKDYESIYITVYRKDGMNTAVIIENRSVDNLAGRVYIDGKDIDAPVNGYIGGQKQGIYCCVISDLELAGIVAGDMVEIRH